MSTRQTTSTPATTDADLEALAAEIASTTGVTAATALQLAITQRPALLQYAQQWDAAARTTRPRVQTTPTTTDPA